MQSSEQRLRSCLHAAHGALERDLDPSPLPTCDEGTDLHMKMLQLDTRTLKLLDSMDYNNEDPTGEAFWAVISNSWRKLMKTTVCSNCLISTEKYTGMIFIFSKHLLFLLIIIALIFVMTQTTILIK